MVADGVVEDPDAAPVGHLVAGGDEGEVVVDSVQHHGLPPHPRHGQAVRTDVGPDICDEGNIRYLSA